jgi:hypothetical protein
MLNFVQAYYDLISSKSEFTRSYPSIYFQFSATATLHYSSTPALQVPENPFFLEYPV